MLIMHGRRRVGKSYLLGHFAGLHPENTVYFIGDKSSEKTNVRNFCEELDKVLHAGDFLKSFETWADVYSYLKNAEIPGRLVLIIDEFTYLYNSNPAYDSGLQIAIDTILRKKNIFLILCGSEVSVIEDIIDNSSNPLYGRKTAELKLLPFTYREARAFFPRYDAEQAITAYSVLGGIPFYLSLFDDRKSIKENIITHCLSTTGVLLNEIETLLRMELKETYFYKGIMLAINAGASTFNTIKDRVGEEGAKTAKYLSVLCDLGFIKREVPCGEKAGSRNTLYSVCDNYFAFYFTFVFRKQGMLNGLISPELYYEREVTKERLSAFVGHRFEGICEAYLKERFYEGKMPFFAETLGRWWGSNPVLKRLEEIDIVALDDDNVLFCECKYTAGKFGEKELKDLEDSALCISRPNKHFMIFAKNGVSNGVKKKIEGNASFAVITLGEL